MEETILNVFMVVVSLLLSKEYNVIQDVEQDDDILVGIQDREYFLLKEAAKLEQGETSVSMELPHLNQEASQSFASLPMGEGDMSDAEQIMPNVGTTVLHEQQMSTVGDLDNFRQKAIAPDDHKELKMDKRTLPLPNVDQSLDQNFSQEDVAQSDVLKKKSHHEVQDDKTSFMDPKIPTNQRLSGVTQKNQSGDQEDTYSWYLWKAFSIISFIRLLQKLLKPNSKAKHKILSSPNGSNASKSPNISAKVSHFDYKTLTRFYDQCVLVAPSNTWQTCEFVEGFVNDLLETVRNMSSEDTNMEIGDFVGVGSLYEQWALKKSLVCDIHIPIRPTKPYSFEFEFLGNRSGSLATQYWYKIKMVKGGDVCPCSNSDFDDMLCLIHPQNKKDDVIVDCIGGPLCQENSPYLSKTRIVKWFKAAIRKAWEEISHKYEFELTFQNRENPGSLKVRFRSGRVILFNVTPIVKFKGSEAHLVSYLPTTRDLMDTHWPVSFTCYENTLLQHLTETLPDNACHIHCLQILSFLHKHQIGLTGKCGLTSYHLKNVVIHFLLDKKAFSWQPEQIVWRLDDVLSFLQQRLRAKELHHVLVGNPLIPSDIGLPKDFRDGKPINLFLPLLSDEELYFKTDRHLTEMIRNMPVLIYEYGSEKNN